MFKSFFWSKQWAWWAYGGAGVIIFFVVGSSYLEILWNDWIKGFYDILGSPKEHTLEEFYLSILTYAGIAAGFIWGGTISLYITQRYTLWWREAISDYYTSQWVAIGHKIEGEAQRIQEDAQRLATIVEDYAEQILNILIILPLFLGRLWALGVTVNLSYLAAKAWIFAPIFTAQGCLVYIVLILSVIGTFLTIFFGKPLPRIQYQNQVVEAAYRRGLELAVDNKPRPNLYQELAGLFLGLRLMYHRYYWAVAKFNLWRITFSQIMVIMPYLLIAPNIFSGAATLGDMQQTINIFDTVRAKFSFFINNWRGITEFISIYIRLREFEANLNKYKIPDAVSID